ncbi:hypothetical protein GTP46_29085 [Duganella sp. FT135W]|uniref:O-antigen ligase-related domain-containing protein n=1 Tax=Duganella flavida TaxID=2692175 RepID=A0A6L8KH74_9BURK|nr:O-antigen ligase family protein [Duganella flavida]MYM26676.1 hypothetical protein [Duganella flavida]
MKTGAKKKSNAAQWLLISLGLFLAVFLGLVSAVANGWIALLMFLPVIPAMMVLRDFRVGVVLLMLLLPVQYAPLMPQSSALNFVNLATLLTFAALFLNHFMGHVQLVKVPRFFWWAYLIPISVGMLLGLRHIHEAPNISDYAILQTPFSYLMFAFVRPLLTLVAAWLLGAAVLRSKRPRLFIFPLMLAALLPALLLLGFEAKVGSGGMGLMVLRGMLDVLGMHANGFGQFFGIAFTILLFMAPAMERPLERLFLMLTIGAVLVALILTFSRGGYVVALVGFTAFVIIERKYRYAVMVMAVVLAVGLVAPDAVLGRLTTGIEDTESSRGVVAAKTEALTAGRAWLWKQMLPEVKKSPLWGSGVGSVAWSAAAKSGMIRFAHPHNVFLRVLLDLGLIGFGLMVVFCRLLIRRLRAIAADPATPHSMAALAKGTWVALIAMLLGDFAGGHYLSGPETAILWLSIGILLPLMAKYEPLRKRAGVPPPVVAA